MKHRAVLIIGSNVGDRRAALDQALDLLAVNAGEVTDRSAIYESTPWGRMDEGTCDFLNQVLVLETDMEPEELLDETQKAERLLGRLEKGEMAGDARKYASRIIDIDILYYDDQVMGNARLTVPHPLIPQREFVLEPLAEVMPEYVDPATGKTVQQMLDELRIKNDRNGQDS